jgi:Flp pilus assembly protein TadG
MAGSTSRRARGQALVEFALVVPVFLLITFAIIQLGLLLGGQNALVNAVRETARYASTYRVSTASEAASACTQVQDFMLSDAKGLLSIPGFDPSRVTSEAVTYSWIQSPDTTYFVQIRVSVAYSFPLYVPIVASLLDNAAPHQSAKLAGQEEMRIENEGLQINPGDVSC